MMMAIFAAEKWRIEDLPAPGICQSLQRNAIVTKCHPNIEPGPPPDSHLASASYHKGHGQVRDYRPQPVLKVSTPGDISIQGCLWFYNSHLTRRPSFFLAFGSLIDRSILRERERERERETQLCAKEENMAGRIVVRSIVQTLISRSRPVIPPLFSRSEDSPTVHILYRYSTFSKSVADWRLPFATGISGRRWFSADVSQLPVITDPYVERPFKDLMAASWDELPDAVIHDTKKALSKASDDKSGQEALANIFRAAEAVEQFGGVLVSLRMELDERSGLSGEKVAPLPDELKDALHAVYRRYTTYLDAFSPEETYLRKKVEMELGTKMIHIKMRCSGLESDWGKIAVLGTSGLSGSYVEQRA